MRSPYSAHGAILFLTLGLFQSIFADPGISREKQAVIEQVDALEQEIENISMQLW